MSTPDFYAALGSTAVLAGSIVQLLREARGLGLTVGAFSAEHEKFVVDTVRERRRALRWFEVRSWVGAPRAVRAETIRILPEHEVAIVRDISRFSLGWALVAVGSLSATVAAWWQVIEAS